MYDAHLYTNTEWTEMTHLVLIWHAKLLKRYPCPLCIRTFKASSEIDTIGAKDKTLGGAIRGEG